MGDMPPANCSAPSVAVEVSVATLLLLECGLGLLGNAVALWTFFFRLKVWKPYAVYLLNLVVADLLLTFCLPFHAAFYLRRKAWRSVHASCQTLLFLQVLGRGVGIAFLTAVAMDRYFRVVHPWLKVNLLSPRAAWGVSGFVWLLLLGLMHQSLFISEAACPSLEPRGQSPSASSGRKHCSSCSSSFPLASSCSAMPGSSGPSRGDSETRTDSPGCSGPRRW